MLDNHHTDLYYLQSRRNELIQAIESDSLQTRQQAAPGLRDRLYNSVGDLLIAWGQKLKKDTSYDELCQDCA
jgi:hypothetical protein